MVFKSAPTYTTRSQIAHHPFGIAISLLLVCKHGLVCVTEREVESLSREVTDDVGGVTSPQRNDTLRCGRTTEAVNDAVISTVQTTRLKHFILISRNPRQFD